MKLSDETKNLVYYRPQVCTPVCHSVHRGISFQACITGHMTGDLHPGGSPFQGSAPTGVCIQEGLGRPHLVCIGGGLGRPSSQDTWDTTGYVNKRAVRIRLECFLVYCGLTSVIYIESFWQISRPARDFM